LLRFVVPFSTDSKFVGVWLLLALGMTYLLIALKLSLPDAMRLYALVARRGRR